jgi:hypothetical protein
MKIYEGFFVNIVVYIHIYFRKKNIISFKKIYSSYCFFDILGILKRGVFYEYQGDN